MSEWQPAKLRYVHDRTKSIRKPVVIEEAKARSVTKRIVRIRETFSADVEAYRAIGCDGSRFFSIHPEDCGVVRACACEHEVLTD